MPRRWRPKHCFEKGMVARCRAKLTQDLAGTWGRYGACCRPKHCYTFTCPRNRARYRMELFLNFVWVLLFAPAGWIWWRSRNGFDAGRCFWTLACALVLLFPVISATDDLHAAAQAMEESSTTKRSLTNGNVARTQHEVPSHPVLISPAFANAGLAQICACIQKASCSFPKAHVSGIDGDRAPPTSFLTYTS